MKIAVIGAGIVGLTSAYYLAKSGHQVSVYEQESYPAMRTSFANGGQISVSNSETWTTWSNIIKGIRWLGKKDAPLLIHPSLDWDRAIWLAKFIYHTANNDYAKNTAETIATGINARRLYAEMIAEENLEFDQTPSGILHFYKDQKYWANAKSVKDLYNSNGCEWDLLTPGQVQSLDPALYGIKDVIGGAWTPSDWTGDIHKCCISLASVLESKYDVKFYYNTVVNNLTTGFTNYDRVVVANGVGSTKLSKSIGDNTGVYPVKGYSITINNVDAKYLPKVSLLDDQAKIVTASLGSNLRVAGTAELCGENYDIRRDRIEPLLNWVKTNFPEINRHDYTSWACLRPMTPNMMPIVKRSTNDSKVFYNTGHGHLGWTLAPATAAKLAEIIQ